MSHWKQEKQSKDFKNLLYDDDEEEHLSELEEEEISDFEEEQVIKLENSDVEDDKLHMWSALKEAHSYLPITSRSPIGFRDPSYLGESPPVEVVLKTLDEGSMPMDLEDVQNDEEYVLPDTHSLYEHPVESSSSDKCVGERGRYSRSGAGRPRGRGRGARRRGSRYRAQEGGNRWTLGHPLTEIWMTDDDVPPELLTLVRSIIAKREKRLQDAVKTEGEKDGRNRCARGNVSDSEEDEFFDAYDGTRSLFEWLPMDSFQGKEENFMPEHTGSVQTFNSAYDAFRSYWDDDILDFITTQMNLYASKIKTPSFTDWEPTNRDEILCLFSFWIMLGIVRMPTITSCFSVDPLLKTDIFRKIFTRKRYEKLTRALYFINTDISNIGGFGSRDSLHGLRPIISHLNIKFQSNYALSKDICIDESITPWKGKSNIKQYLRHKATKLGIKTFELCESVTGYLWSFIVDDGKQATTGLEHSSGVSNTSAAVRKLIDPLLNRGYRLFMNNSSPLLARFLKQNGTDCVGTLRPTQRHAPPLIEVAPLRKGEYIARHSGDVAVLTWQDNTRVTMISTCHDASTALSRVSSHSIRPVPFKPKVVLDYDNFIGGVDLKDQLLEPYLMERKRCCNSNGKLFKRFVNVSILNSRTLLQSSTQKQYDNLSFRLQLVNSILTHHLERCPLSRKQTVSSSRSARHHQPFNKFTPTHWPTSLDAPDGSFPREDNRNFRKRCVVCLRQGRKSQKTAFCCEDCRVPLCIKKCFKAYHVS